jgi:uncharacterized protein (TIGR00288 family)
MRNGAKRVVLLIDADNPSADVIEQAVAAVLDEHGAIHVRRAYCTAESALKNLALFKRHSIRPMVNIAAGKNSTDIALAVDAIDLVVAERPDVVVIVSSDSDFAPLVVRLREKGCRVEGIGQDGKTGDETVAVYDRFTVLAHRKAARAPAPRPPGRRAAAPRSAPPPPALPPPPPPAPPLPDEVLRILDAVPELLAGKWVELGIAAEQLRRAKLLGKAASSTKVFMKHAAQFALKPEKRPNKVQYVGPRP